MPKGWQEYVDSASGRSYYVHAGEGTTQFEVGRAQIGKGGIVRDWQAVADAVARIEHWLVADMGWELIGTATSPIDGQDGNREFLMAGRKSRNG